MKSSLSSVLILCSLLLMATGCQKSDGEVSSEHPAVGSSDGHDSENGGAEGEHGDSPHAEGGHSSHGHPRHKILVTAPVAKDVISTQQYVCQIHSRRHIEICALEGGYLEEIPISEGQTVAKGDLMFKILPTLYKAKLDSDVAEVQLAQVEYDNTKKLVEQDIVSDQELKLAAAKLAKAKAKVELAQAELDFANVKAPFTGIVDRQMCQQGSLIEEGDVLTTLSDNSTMWAYFNVPESRYLEYKTQLDESNGQEEAGLRVELRLANGKTFSEPGKIGAIEADFNNETGNIAFRADFSNPKTLLRHGQTGTILMHRDLKNVVVIPQRATFEILAKRYVYVIDDEGIVRQRDITVRSELEDIFVIGSGVEPGEKIVLEGVQQVRDGDKVEYEFREPLKVLDNLKYHAE